MDGSDGETEVLVVGFGPVGATIANLLGRYGVRTLAIDAATEIFPQPRAIALDNEALRILQAAGLSEGAFETIAIPEVRYRSPYVGQLARLETGGCLDGHPKLVTFYQPELESELRSRAREHPSVTVELGIELVEFAEVEGGVRARLRELDGKEHTVHAKYLVGADGAKSRVRKALGVGFDGRSYAEDWLIVDAKRDSSSLDHIEFLCDPRRPAPHMPAPGGRERWEFMLHPGESGRRWNIRRRCASFSRRGAARMTCRSSAPPSIAFMPAPWSAFKKAGCSWPATRRTSHLLSRGKGSLRGFAMP